MYRGKSLGQQKLSAIQAESLRVPSTVQNCSSRGRPLLQAECDCSPVCWFTFFFLSLGTSLLFLLLFQVISSSVFFFFNSSTVCLSTQRLRALAKGKMFMGEMKMRGLQANESAQKQQRGLCPRS